MPEGSDDPVLSAEGELALARIAMHSERLDHAAGHVASALEAAPTLPEVHETLAQLAVLAGAGAVDLYPITGKVYVGTIVARAHLCAAAGRLDEAVYLLALASAYAPHMAWAEVRWFDDANLPRKVSPTALTRVFMLAAGSVPDPAPAGLRVPLQPYLRLAQRAVGNYPAEGTLHGAASALARRLGALAEAVRWARSGATTEPSVMTEMWLGYAYRSVGRLDEAVAALGRAAAYDPNSPALQADLANLVAAAGHLAEAVGLAERALATKPDNDCLVNVVCRLRHRRDGEVDHLVELADYLREHRTGGHEHNDLAVACAEVAWLGTVPPPDGAGTTGLRRACAAGGAEACRVRLSGYEPPSAVATVIRQFPGTVVEMDGELPPELCRSRRRAQPRLWAYQGMRAVPAPGPPSPAATVALAAITQASLARPLAACLVHPPAAYDAAIRLAGVPPDDLVALLVHPPPVPTAGTDPVQWVRASQVWACLGLLHHGTDAEWHSSARREVLSGIAFGVEDWTTEAALFALITAAWVDPGARRDVADLVAERFSELSRARAHRPVSIARSVAMLALATPELPDRVRTIARRVVAEETRRAGTEPAATTTTPTPPPRRPAPGHRRPAWPHWRRPGWPQQDWLRRFRRR